MKRKLASVQKIKKLEPIKGADRIEKATILGWEVVVRKGEFKKGDLCVFFEVDSILPPKKVFEFLAPKYRVKTVKMRKQISQGIALPFNILIDFNYNPSIQREGVDLTNIIGVEKYIPYQIKEKEEKEIKNNYLMKFKLFRNLKKYFTTSNKFPSFIPKTDETRIQNNIKILKNNLNKHFYIMEKLDGQSATFVINNKEGFNPFKKREFSVYSRNLRRFKSNKKCNWWEIAKKFNIEEKLKGYRGNIAIQGEIIGPGVQGNKYKLDSLDFYVFNVYYIDRKIYYNLSDKKHFCSVYNFKMVPVIDDLIIFNEDTSIKSLVELSNRNSTLAKTKQEGIVVRTRIDEKISFKVINPNFLLDFDE